LCRGRFRLNVKQREKWRWNWKSGVLAALSLTKKIISVVFFHVLIYDVF
jgi:hypothetical protein